MTVLISDEVHLDLKNWSRWLNTGALPHPLPCDHAGSAEGRYLAPSDLGDADLDNPPPLDRMPIDVERAERVERVFRQRLTPLQRRVLAAEFPRRTEFMLQIGPQDNPRWWFDRAKAARSCNTSARNYREALRQAANIVGEEMERQEETA